jgi:hypothetical protein
MSIRESLKGEKPRRNRFRGSFEDFPAAGPEPGEARASRWHFSGVLEDHLQVLHARAAGLNLPAAPPRYAGSINRFRLLKTAGDQAVLFANIKDPAKLDQVIIFFHECPVKIGEIELITIEFY